MENNNILTNFIDSALEIEEEMGMGVYGYYLDYNNWPRDLSKESFAEIEKMLKVLINDTLRHEQAFRDLKDKIKKDE